MAEKNSKFTLAISPIMEMVEVKAPDENVQTKTPNISLKPKKLYIKNESRRVEKLTIRETTTVRR